MEMSNTAVNKIGNAIRCGARDDFLMDQLDVWRKAHGKPMNYYFDLCAALGERIDRNNIIVAQRLKRLPTIIDKLGRHQNMLLSRMHDVAGVRMIVKDMVELKTAEQVIARWKNQTKPKDYVNKPKESGYRGEHYIFKKDGMWVELQLRTHLQHLWATSVETMDEFLKTSMKSGAYVEGWTEFFCLVSAIFARMEQTTVMKKYDKQTTLQLCARLKVLMDEYAIEKKIKTWALTGPVVERARRRDAYYFVLTLEDSLNSATIGYFNENDYEKAFQEYRDAETRESGGSSVLVAVSDAKRIREAYPNYFVDLNKFVKVIKLFIDGGSQLK
ncbi:RelA/SpoT domain-containing protein [Candidatus Saccharibacteria bacterium]|nr:RelA/SpoT domain-containing protein [Candidatus Saccharibacteria bacterium]